MLPRSGGQPSEWGFTSHPPCPEPAVVPLAKGTSGQLITAPKLPAGGDQIDTCLSCMCIRPVPVSAQVNIHVPAPELQSDIIAITGLAANLDRAKAGLLERVKELQAEQEDRVRAGRGRVGQGGSPGGPRPPAPSCPSASEVRWQRESQVTPPPCSELSSEAMLGPWPFLPDVTAAKVGVHVN